MREYQNRGSILVWKFKGNLLEEIFRLRSAGVVGNVGDSKYHAKQPWERSLPEQERLVQCCDVVSGWVLWIGRECRETRLWTQNGQILQGLGSHIKYFGYYLKTSLKQGVDMIRFAFKICIFKEICLTA